MKRRVPKSAENKSTTLVARKYPCITRFLLPSPLKWGLVLVGVSLIAKEVLSYATRKASSDEVRRMKTKLSQLDYLNEQFQQALNQEREAQLQVEQNNQ